MAKRHELKEILSNMAITSAVESIWIKGVILSNETMEKPVDTIRTNEIKCFGHGFQNWLPCLKLLPKLNVPKTLFYMNVSTDMLFFMLLSLMMLTGMCVKARARLFISRTILCYLWFLSRALWSNWTIYCCFCLVLVSYFKWISSMEPSLGK